MIHAELTKLISEAASRLVEQGALPAVPYQPVEVDAPKSAEHGDLATNFALMASKPAGMSPRAIAELMAQEVSVGQDAVVQSVEIAGPGFINFRLNPVWVASTLPGIRPDAVGFSRLISENPLRINMEFVSVNPNGPITIGSGRGAAYGSTLANVLAAAGHTIHREYYINDGVNSEQMRLFAESVRAIALGQSVPENGYKGDYVHEVAAQSKQMFEAGFTKMIAYAEEMVAKGPHPVLERHLPVDRRLQALIENRGALAALEECDLTDLQLVCETLMSDKQGEDLRAFGVTFDTWFSEQSLHASGAVNRDLELLLRQGVADDEPMRTKLKLAKGGKVEEVIQESQTLVVDEDDVAEGSERTLWLRSTKFGDDMDRVLMRRDGRPTYISSDLSYHKDKFNRPPDADKLITIVGPDHHGYLGRLRAVIAAVLLSEGKVTVSASEDPLNEIDQQLFSSCLERDRCRSATALALERLNLLMFQIVRFLKDGKPAPMRKRDGNIYAIIDLITEIGLAVKPNGTPEQKEEAGRDVARFFYLMRHHDTAFDFDLELATKQSDENPVFYVQYAHARICSVIEKGRLAGLEPSELHLARLIHPKEKALLLKIWELPREIGAAANDYGVNRFTTYAVELSRLYHSFYDQCRVVQSEDVDLSTARLRLCEATRTTLQIVFGLLGISSPTRMDRAD